VPTKFKAIQGRKLRLPARVQPRARQILTNFQRAGVHTVSQYPPQMPAKPRVSQSGKPLSARPIYKRTGSLGRTWSAESGVTTRGGARGTTIEASVISAPALAPYNIHVVGPKTGPKGERQTEEMARRNWPAAPDVLSDLWSDRYVPQFFELLHTPR
jgi:hypothetical protein